MPRLALAIALCSLSCGAFLAEGGGATNKTSEKLVYTGDFLTATVIVGRYYGRNVRDWLVNCSSSEGGHGEFVWRDHIPPVRGEDKPGGWMQFFASTFYSNAHWAYADARRRGLRIHPKARSYYEPLGQAVVAAAIYARQGSGQWTGYNC